MESDAGIADAITPWRDALHWDALSSVPEIVYQASNAAIGVRRVHPNGFDTWCATNDRTSYIALDGGTSCQLQFFSNPAALITHELAEVLGLGAGTDSNLEGAGLVPDDCTIRIKGLTNLNSAPCAQEVEYIFAGYGLTTVDVNNIWNQTVVTDLSLATRDLTMEKDQAAADSVTSITVDPPGTSPISASATQATYSWVSGNLNVALVTPSAGGRGATIKGVNAGTTYIRVVAAGTSVANGVVGTVARRLGDTVKVTVTPGPPPPPPGTGFRISDISGAPVPITQAGTYYVNATLVNPVNEFWQIRWDVTYSSPVHSPLHTSYVQSTMLALQAPAGSYRITVTATAQSEHLTTSHTTYFPVCTGGGGGGGDLLRAPLPDSLTQTGSGAGAGTDAVGGC